jgi:PAS domain S-box-containing protein
MKEMEGPMADRLSMLCDAPRSEPAAPFNPAIAGALISPNTRSKPFPGERRDADDTQARSKLRVLLVQANPAEIELVLQALKKERFDVSSDVVQTAEEFISRIHLTTYDVILADYNLPHWSGMEPLDILSAEQLDVPLVTVTGYIREVHTGENTANLVASGWDSAVPLTRLVASVHRALKEKQLRDHHRQSAKVLADQKFALDQHAIVAVTDVQGTITYVNDKFCSISQYSRDELMGKNHRLLNSRHHPKEFFHNMYREIANGKVWRGEIKNRAKDGSFYWVDTTIVPTSDAQGKPERYVAIRADITARKLAEEALVAQTRELSRRDQELARSNFELEQFAYVASHDLQEPLRTIANYTQLLAEKYRGKLDEQADKYIAYSVNSAVRMQTLIQDLLKLSRVGKAEVETQPVNCLAAVTEALKNLQAAVTENQATVHWNGLPVVNVMADFCQLTQVFQNLISNGIKFHGSHAPAIQISSSKKGSDWEIMVSDNGIGIPSERWQDIFVIFRRLHTRAEYPGNGIGLSICKKIIERHGGKLWIEAQDTPGCCFKFTLPEAPSFST